MIEGSAMSYTTKLSKEQLHYNLMYQITREARERGIEYSAQDLESPSKIIENVLTQSEDRDSK